MLRTWGIGSLLAAVSGVVMAMSHVPPGSAQPGIGATMQSRCADAARQMHALFVQVKGLEGVLDQKQERMNAAKGADARLDAAVAMINELADSRVKLREKEEAMRDLLVGHMLEHLTSRAQNRELEMQSCALFKDLRRSVEQQVDRDQAPPKK